MICCGLERDSQFCPKCGKLLAPFNQDPPRWVMAEKGSSAVTITMYADRHRIPMVRSIDLGEAKLLRDELTGILSSENTG